MMKDIILEMANKNIGSLCLFLKNEKNKEYLEYLNNNTEIISGGLSEKIYYLAHNKIELCHCGDFKAFIGFKNGYRTTCGKKECFVESRRKTCIEKYGVDNPKKSKEILEIEKVNIHKKWGGKHYMNDPNVRESFNKTMNIKYGVNWSQQSKEISDKSRKTWIDNPDKDNIIKKRNEIFKNKTSDEKEEIIQKRKETLAFNHDGLDNYYKYFNTEIKKISVLKYGVSHFLSSKEIIQKRSISYKNNITNKILNKLPSDIKYIDRISNENKTDSYIKLKCDKCLESFDITRIYLNLRISIGSDPCLICNPIITGRSNMEVELANFINQYNSDILLNTKISNSELDIYLPSLNLAFEFNGLYWHSEKYKEKNYHKYKTNLCIEKNIDLIHIWEDDWIYRRKIVESMVLNKLGFSKKVFARKCEIRFVDSKSTRHFLNENHIQGFVGSKVRIGLYYENDLVSLMTFGSLRKVLNQISTKDSWELLRFCNKLEYTIVGGASKLISFFIKTFKPNKIVSYSDNSRGVGKLYDNIGFKLVNDSTPNYYWVVDGLRMHRYNYRKSKLIKQGYSENKTEVEIMHDCGYYRIFDCGCKKWEYSI